jgi:hypothetical protein
VRFIYFEKHQIYCVFIDLTSTTTASTADRTDSDMGGHNIVESHKVSFFKKNIKKTAVL